MLKASSIKTTGFIVLFVVGYLLPHEQFPHWHSPVDILHLPDFVSRMCLLTVLSGFLFLECVFLMFAGSLL